MNIIGPDTLVFGVDDLASCAQYLVDYGLSPVGERRFEALDGTGIELAAMDAPDLPPALPSGSMLRETVYGVADLASLDRIAAELGKDREVVRRPDGSLHTFDDQGFALGFQLTVRRPIHLPREEVNSPGAPFVRAINNPGVDEAAEARPRTLSHVVYFVPDSKAGEAFYVDRLGFKCTDRFTDVGPFLRPPGTQEHHTLFLIQAPAFMQGCEHLAFHMGGPTEVLLAGTRFLKKQYQSYWGPGRHKFGSNWFWYFNSPLGCHVEYDADMDRHDDNWRAREAPLGAEASQAFLFQYREKWAPGPGPSDGAKAPTEKHAAE